MDQYSNISESNPRPPTEPVLKNTDLLFCLDCEQTFYPEGNVYGCHGSPLVKHMVVKQSVKEDNFTVKDSGKRKSFDSGMVRDVQEGKIQYTRLLDGPMLKRWAEHITKGAVKYPDVSIGKANWTLADGKAELQRFKESAFRHFIEYMSDEDTGEDKAAGVFFNINGAEFVKEKIKKMETLPF